MSEKHQKTDQPGKPPEKATAGTKVSGAEMRMPVVEEQLHVDKKQVETGRVRISKSVTENLEEVTVPLTYEQVEVERVPVNRYVDEAPPATRYEGDTMIVPVLKEVLVVEKKLLLVEELHIKKQQIQTEEKQQVTLRKETVNVTRSPSKDSESEAH